jgi:CheY-like chemotaxis protein
MRIPDLPPDTTASGVRVLVADDDPALRSLLAKLLGAAVGVTSVIEAADGAAALELARKHRVEVVVLDLNMPNLDGVEAALRLHELQPSLRILLHSSDPELLRQRAAGLELPLFDKADFDGLINWVERQANETSATQNEHAPVAPIARKVDLCCSTCGYGIVSRTPPARCPMCGGEATWTASLSWTSRAALRERRAS